MLSWSRFFKDNEDIHTAISEALASRRIKYGEVQYPKDSDIMKCFSFNEPKDIKVVILGQDPYHGPKEACGLAFSVNKDVTIPPSLRNIYKELKNDLGIQPPKHGDLTSWAKQGVLLLNTCLTVAKDKPGSHADVGWNLLTDEIIHMLSEKGNKVFILWGNHAKSKKDFIVKEKNHVIMTSHPSPFAANKGFFGSKPFSKTNEYLVSKGIKPIDWSITE